VGTRLGPLAAGGRAGHSDYAFQFGSISKPVFALAVMKLAETGTIDLDTDVND